MNGSKSIWIGTSFQVKNTEEKCIDSRRHCGLALHLNALTMPQHNQRKRICFNITMSSPLEDKRRRRAEEQWMRAMQIFLFVSASLRGMEKANGNAWKNKSFLFYCELCCFVVVLMRCTETVCVWLTSHNTHINTDTNIPIFFVVIFIVEIL